MRIRLYSKRRCPLCEVVRDQLKELRSRFEFELEERYIDDSPSDWERFRYDVPVVFIDGERAYNHRLDVAEVEKRLLTAGTPVAHSRPRDA